MNVSDIARVCHEANRAYCLALGDSSQPRWEDAPGWQIASAEDGVRAGPKSPRASHEQWLAHKLTEGWQYGPVKDPAKKEHPCLVPYDELPEEQRLKDELFQAIRGVLSTSTRRT